MTKVFEGMYVGGQWISNGKTFSDLNPSDDSVWAEIPDGGRHEAYLAIRAAQEAFSEWSSLPFNQRSKYMLKVADIFENLWFPSFFLRI